MVLQSEAERETDDPPGDPAADPRRCLLPGRHRQLRHAAPSPRTADQRAVRGTAGGPGSLLCAAAPPGCGADKGGSVRPRTQLVFLPGAARRGSRHRPGGKGGEAAGGREKGREGREPQRRVPLKAGASRPSLRQAPGGSPAPRPSLAGRRGRPGVAGQLKKYISKSISFTLCRGHMRCCGDFPFCFFFSSLVARSQNSLIEHLSLNGKSCLV